MDHPSAPREPMWSPPTGPPYPLDPPYRPAGSEPARRRRLWPRVALVAAAAALGFALAVPTLAVLRDGLAPVAPEPRSSVVAEQPASPTTDLDLLAGLVDIDTRLAYGSGRAAGTGMIISEDGQVLTNAHVIDGAGEIVVTIVATGRTYQATVLGSDESRDVALLQMEDVTGLATVQLGDSASVQPGDPVVAVGNAGGTGGGPSVSEGTVTDVDETITVNDPSTGASGELSGLIETDAALEPGDSGGPMFDADGDVIGISTAADAGRGFPGRSRESYAVAIDTAEEIAAQILAGEGSATVQIGIRGFLGVQVDPSRSSGGAAISEVLAGTPAEDAGLEAGDLITGIGGRSIESDDGLTEGLHGRQPGDEVEVTWTDLGGDTHRATVTLATGPA